MKHWAAHAVLCAASSAAWAQTTEPVLVYPGEHMPTRMQLCQREVQTDQADRQRLMRACLSRRLEGEGVIERQCRRQAQGTSGQAARHAAQRACERQALAVPSARLPRRPAPPPRPTPVPEATAPVMPAAGDR